MGSFIVIQIIYVLMQQLQFSKTHRFNILFRAKKLKKVEYLARKAGVFLPFAPKVLGCGDKTETWICLRTQSLGSILNRKILFLGPIFVIILA